MNISELRALSKADLNKQILDLKKSIFELNMQKNSGQNIKTSELRSLKKQVARVKTIMKEQDLGINKG